MPTNKPFVLSIAGFDPSGGAGVLADVKTFEQHRVYGLSITTANTIQTEDQFHKILWTDLSFVIESIEILFKNYTIKSVKIGIVPSLQYLKAVVFTIKKLSPKTKIIWDTVLKSTTDFEFLTPDNQTDLVEILKSIHLITPNFKEILLLLPSQTEVEISAKILSEYCFVLVKGGHNPTEKGIDYLYTEKEIFKLLPKNIFLFEKHGSGCVLSSAITANIALGQNTNTACVNAKNYIETYLQSCQTKLGFHHV